MADLTEEQIQELQTKVGDMEKELNELRPLKDSSTKAQEEFKAKEETWQKEKADLEQAANPNWQKARKTIDALKQVAKEKGIEVDDEGNIINRQGVTVEEVQKRAVEAARGEMLNARLEELLGDYDEESGKIVRHYYNRLITGETIDLKNIKKFVAMAESAAEVETGKKPEKSKAFIYSGGQGPRYPDEKQKLDDATAKELADRMGIKLEAEKK